MKKDAARSNVTWALLVASVGVLLPLVGCGPKKEPTTPPPTVTASAPGTPQAVGATPAPAGIPQNSTWKPVGGSATDPGGPPPGIPRGPQK